MEPFEVGVNNEILTIRPLETGEYEVYKDDRLLATLFPDIGIDMQVKWVTTDLLPIGYVQKVGEAIEAFEA